MLSIKLSAPTTFLDALEERDEVFCYLTLLVLEGDGALAVVRLDAVVAEAGVVPSLDHNASRRLGEQLERVLSTRERRRLPPRWLGCVAFWLIPRQNDLYPDAIWAVIYTKTQAREGEHAAGTNVFDPVLCALGVDRDHFGELASAPQARGPSAEAHSTLRALA